MKLNEVWFRTFLNIQDTKLNHILYLISELSAISKYKLSRLENVEKNASFFFWPASYLTITELMI